MRAESQHGAESREPLAVRPRVARTRAGHRHVSPHIAFGYAIGLLAVGAASTLSAQVARSNLQADVLQWVDQLDAASLSQRKAAEQAILNAGVDALQHLPESKPGMSVEASERLARVRAALQSRRTNQQAKGGPIVVRLTGVETLGEALEAISRDSGIEFDFQGDPSLAIDAVEQPLPFWHALDLVLDQAELDINFYGGDRGELMIVPRVPARPSRVDSAAYSGIYRVEPTLVTSRRHLVQTELSGLNVNIHLSWEPLQTPIGLTIPIQQLSARLDDDQVLDPQASGATIDIATSSDIAFTEFYLPFELPAGQPDKITSVSGVIRALMPGERHTFELPLSELNTAKRSGAMSVSIEDIRQSDALHQVRLAVELENADRALESHRHWIFENDVFVKLPDGSRIDHLGFEVYRQTESGVGVGYLFNVGGAIGEASLIYESPTAVVPSEVPFVIQDIPLP